MNVLISGSHLRAIEAHGESTYPDEGAGFMLGRRETGSWRVEQVLPLENRREQAAQFNRYELAPQDFARAELEAAKAGLDLIGVFHSHPDHPARPSEFDRDHAWPNFLYLITAVAHGRAERTLAWQLDEDRSSFSQNEILAGDE